MAKIRWINKGEQVVPVNITEAEKHYNAQYIADLCIVLKDGSYTDDPVAIFWVEKPSKPEYSNYFGLFIRNSSLVICSGVSVAEGTWNACEAENGEIIFSRYRHDFRSSADGTAMVDGGRDYFRHRGKSVHLKVSGPDLVII